MADSPYKRRAYAYLERGYCVIPIAPGTKRPGSWTQADGWRGMYDWERFFDRLPTEIEVSHWDEWPDAGIGLLCGKISGIVGIDRDYDAPGTDALEQIIPYTPLKKKGAKGYTAFFRYTGERSCSFNVNGVRVLDVLSDGRQTLMPGTIHPDGHAYIWLTEDIIEDYDPADIPALPAGWLDLVAATLAPAQTEEDKKFAAKAVGRKDDSEPLEMSIRAAYYRDLNSVALSSLENWVPKLLPKAKRERDGYRVVATWRNCENANVGVHPNGVFDFGGNYGLTPIDLIMYAHGTSFIAAADLLRNALGYSVEPIQMTVGGVSITDPAPALTPAQAVQQAITPPWMKPVLSSQPEAPVFLPPETSIAPAPAMPGFISSPPGVIGEIARWITATAPKAQPELSVAAAIALCSVVMGRTYRSQYGNFTSLYLVMIAKSTEGKEHPQGCVEKILTAAGLEALIGGSGYTSSGAVFSALLKSPVHLATIDELGKLLKMSRSSGQANSEAAIDKLIEAFGRLDGVMRPPTYSTMTLSKTQAASVERVVYNPAITLLGATTPGTFYSALTNDLVQDGFLGRCIVVESKQPRQLTRFVDRTEPPPRILDWCSQVYVGNVIDGNLSDVNPPAMKPTTIELPFDESCGPLLSALELELNDEKEASEGEGLDVILGRTMEKSMRLAMIVAKASDPRATCVLAAHLEWAIKYVRHYDLDLVRAVRRERVASQMDGDIKRALKFIKSAPKYSTDKVFGPICSEGGMPHSKLLKLMAMSAKQFRETIETALESKVITKAPGVQWGYGGDVYYVPNDQ